MTSSEWLQLCAWAGDVTRSASTHGARVVQTACSEERIAFAIAFDDATARSGFEIDVHRPSGSWSAAFGLHVSISDYDIEPLWMQALQRAVAAGGWRERVHRPRWLGPTRYEAELDVLGRPELFRGTLTPTPWWGASYAEVTEHSPWSKRVGDST